MNSHDRKSTRLPTRRCAGVLALGALLLSATGCQDTPSQQKSSASSWRRAVRFGLRLVGASTTPEPPHFPALGPLSQEALPPAPAGLQAEPALSAALLAGIPERRKRATKTLEDDVYPCVSSAAVFSLPLTLEGTPQGEALREARRSAAEARVDAAVAAVGPSQVDDCWPDEGGALPAGVAACGGVGKERGTWLWLGRSGRPVLELYFVPLPGSGFDLTPLERELAARAEDRQLVIATERAPGCRISTD